jgi:transcription elongation GreA/GreB family factor
MTLKNQLLQKCTEFVSQKIKTIEDSIHELRLAANSETKSSVGDKYETGRAMIQLEIEKNATQLKAWQNQLFELQPIDSNKKSNKVEFSAIVKCTNANYFIAQACGKFIINKETYYTISVSAPIYLAMSGKTEGEQFSFNGQQMSILEIL